MQNNTKSKFYCYLAKGLGAAADQLMIFAVRIDELRVRMHYKSIRLNDQYPSFEQYANRLIEYMDHPYINAAYNKYVMLVQAGFSPDDAFNLVTKQ